MDHCKTRWTQESCLVQVGVGRDERTGGISFPIYPSATYRHPALGESTGYDYTRSGNPTRALLEEAIADLDGGARGLAFSSGMAALTTLRITSYNVCYTKLLRVPCTRMS